MFNNKRNTMTSFKSRCEYALRGIVAREDSRAFDDCFEMWDGAAVVTWLWRIGEKNPEFMAAMNRDFEITGNKVHPWKAIAAKYSDWPTDRLAELAANIRKREKRHKSYITEPTDQGNQYVIPGCEKDKSRGPDQMSLF